MPCRVFVGVAHDIGAFFFFRESARFAPDGDDQYSDHFLLRLIATLPEDRRKISNLLMVSVNHSATSAGQSSSCSTFA